MVADYEYAKFMENAVKGKPLRLADMEHKLGYSVEFQWNMSWNIPGAR